MGKTRAEIQKAYRQRLKEKNAEEYLRHERERMRRNYIPAAELSENDRKIRNDRNREKLRAFYERKRQQRQANQVAELETSGYDSGQASTSQERGRLPLRMNFVNNRRKGAIRRWKRELSHASARIKQLELERQELRKKYRSAQRKVQRQKAKNAGGNNSEKRQIAYQPNEMTPRKETEKMLNDAGLSLPQKKAIKKSLMMGNVLLREINTTKSESSRNKLKVVHNVISGKVTKKYRCATFLSNKTGLCRHRLNETQSQVRPVERSVRKSTVKLFQERVETFLKREDNSRAQPGKRDNKKIGKDERVQTHVLTDYLSNLYEKFISENPNIKISFTSFTRARPKHILTAAFSSRSSCLCTKHQNAVLTIKTLRKEGFNVSINPEKGFEQIPSAEVIKENLKESVLLGQWKRVEVEEKGKRKYVTKIVEAELQVEDFINHIQKQMTEFEEHVSRVRTQYEQIRKLKEELPKHELILQLDFAENYSCRSMEEVQSAYFNQTTVTLHPVVVYKRSEDNSLVHKSFIIVSDEMAHKSSTVVAFIADIIPVLKEMDSELQCIHYWSDSPTSQYRNKQMFNFVANHEAEYGVKARWNFFEAGHGKGPCDGLGGTCKRLADEAMRSGRAVIQDAKGFFEWAQRSSMKNVTFRFVSTQTCSVFETLMEKKDVKTIKGTMKVHAVVGLGESKVMVREVSCYCHICLTGQTCDTWRLETTKGSKAKPVNEQTIDIADENVEITDTTDKSMETSEDKGDTATTGVNDRDGYRIGDYVAAVYDGKWYVGKIADTDNEESEIEVDFMESRKQLFQWPSKQDLIWLNTHAILCKIDTPVATGKSNRMFALADSDMANITDLFDKFDGK